MNIEKRHTNKGENSFMRERIELLIGYVMRRLPREGEINVDGVYKALNTLSYMEEVVIKELFGLGDTVIPLTIKELCEKRNLTKSEVEHILVRAYNKLAKHDRIRLYHNPTRYREWGKVYSKSGD